MKNLKLLVQRGYVKAAAAGASVGLLLVGQSAHAVLDPSISPAFAGLQTDFNSLMTMVYPIAISIAVALAIFGLVMRFVGRAARG